MATQFGNSLAGYRPFTEYSFQPGKDHQRRRRDTIRILIENALSKTYGKLSPELWRIVSDDDELIRLYTIAEICLAYHQDRYTIGRTTSIWATYTTVDGIEYVSSLSRSPVPGARQIWDSVTSSGTLPLYVSSDHLGIRQIVTDSSLADVNESNPVYWQTIPIECQELSFTGDGYKLREVLRPLMNTPLLWPHPTSPSTIDSLSFFYGGWGEGEVIARMKHLTFNQQGTTGYSVCWAGGEMVSICANQKSEEIKNFGSMWNHNHSVYDEDDDLKWTYHPVAEDEYIQQIWVRGSTKYDTPNALPCWGEGSLGYHLSTPWGLQTYKRPSDIALGFVTSKGRLIIAGSYPDHHGTNTPYSKHREWLMMANTDTRTPITILVSPSANGIPVIASPKSPETTQDMSPPKQTALGPVPRFNPLRTLHYSSASLEDVAQRPARRTFECNISPGLLYNMERLRRGLEVVCGRDNFSVYGDIMQLTIRVHAYYLKNLVAQLQIEGALRGQAMEQLSKDVKEAIVANGWYQIQPHDRE
ncbi:hypothetical protein FLONG3_7298 [Fusarium longipes]|uniref:Uncharacterized protein n=1 Tax=Fusarium longipes TaxID=694270 RepID=A0A395SFI1_9HYPO|nr:hypothetical protein FLONG3_7298 [Fusarium longipes]